MFGILILSLVSVMIDSLGILMINHSASRIRQFLQKIYSICETKKSRVVGVLHSDAMLAQGILKNRG